MRRAVLLLMMLIGAGFLTEGSYMKVKAVAAQWLINSSWAQRDLASPPQVPWPWADTRAIARLQFESGQEVQMVMQDASGESLAFGPGLVAGDIAAESGPLMIAGHRDSHFSNLRQVAVGDTVKLDSWNGNTRTFRIRDQRVIDIRSGSYHLDPQHNSLVLVTCWPFDTLVPGGPERWIVTAVEI